MITLVNNDAISLNMSRLAVFGETYKWGNDFYIGTENGTLQFKEAGSPTRHVRTPVPPASSQKKESKIEITNNLTLGSVPLKSETLSGVIDGVNTVFQCSSAFEPSMVFIYVNGIKQTIVQDYQLSNANTVTFTFSPMVGETLIIEY